MVRSLRAGLDQYMDPDLKRRMQAAAIDKAPSNTMQGLGFLLRKAMLGYDMGQDRKQRTAASRALTKGGENQTKIIDAVEARPAMGRVIGQSPGAGGGVFDGGVESVPSTPAVKAQMARIDPNSGALYGTKLALAELLRTDPNNPYAQGALLNNAGQLSNRNANLQLNQLNNQNKLATLAGTRAYQAKLAKTARDNQLLDAQTEFVRKQKLEEIKLGGKDTRTNLMKNLQAQGLMPGTKQYKDAIAAELNKSQLSTLGKDYQSALADSSWDKSKGGFEAYVSNRTTQKAVATQRALASEAAAIARARPLPPSEAKDENEDIDALNRSSNIIEDVGVTLDLFKSGEFKLSPLLVVKYKAELAAGRSSPGARAFNDMNTTIEKLRNDTLLLNKGMQTEGDAQRALSQLIANKTDQKALIDSLKKIQRINYRAAKERRSSIARRRSRYYKDPLKLRYDNSKKISFDINGKEIRR
jgi:hypothetical protein